MISDSRDTAFNLAVEEYLMGHIAPGQEYLFLYENVLSVVIGRFQNPWQECRTGLARRMGIPVVRRISGGGTVVHGPGNINFSVMAGQKFPDKEGVLDRVIRAVETCGVRLSRDERHNLLLNGAKVSGCAFRQTAHSSLMHGTLLLDADLDLIKTLLSQGHREIESRSVSSHPSPVANLAQGQSGFSIEKVMAALTREWGGQSVQLDTVSCLTEADFVQKHDRLQSPQWIWERTPAFVERFCNLPGLEEQIVVVSVKDGRITHLPEWGSSLIGSPYQGPDLLKQAESNLPDWLTRMAAIVDGDGAEG